MRARGWHNGRQAKSEPAGYGVRISAGDRDTSFSHHWRVVVVELDGAGAAEVALSPSFWRSCPELRGAAIGRWLLDQRVAPWQPGHPPKIDLVPIADNRFRARLTRD